MTKKDREILNGQYDKKGNVIQPNEEDITLDNKNSNIVPVVSIDDDLSDIGIDTDEILEDTSAIDHRTQSMNKKLWILITLWILDKVILLSMFLMFSK